MIRKRSLQTNQKYDPSCNKMSISYASDSFNSLKIEGNERCNHEHNNDKQHAEGVCCCKQKGINKKESINHSAADFDETVEDVKAQIEYEIALAIKNCLENEAQ